MTFFKTDAGRALSKRPNSKNDCTVRAVALVWGLSFDNAYELLALSGRVPHKRFDFKTWAEGVNKQHGTTFQWLSFPAEKGKRRMTPAEFCQSHETGSYILRTAKHVFAVIDGVVLDEQPNAERCVYGAWKLLRGVLGQKIR